MSFPRKQALAVAEELLAELCDSCWRIVVAGSLRRGKETVNDVEILFVPAIENLPDPADLFGQSIPVNLAERAIAALEASGRLSRRKNKDGVVGWGSLNKLAVHVASGIPVDLFATTEENWWVSLVVRTGSLETNLRLTQGARERGYTLLAYGPGIKNLATGQITPAYSEEDLFNLCGVPFAEPEDR